MDDLDLRPAELAGRWYPESAPECDRLLAAVQIPQLRVAGAWGAIVPHAGWVYSGKVAFEALSALALAQPQADLVVIFGGHLTDRDGPRVFLNGAWSTPYGPVHIAEDLAEQIAMILPDSDPETPEEYYEDNAIEVLMPMVKKLWPHAPAAIIGVPPIEDAGRIGAEVRAAALAQGFKQPVFIGSTDLTHYGPNYRFNPAGRGPGGLAWVKEANDPEIIEAMCDLDYVQALRIARRSRNACCPGAIAATLVASRKSGARQGLLTRHTTSFDEHPNDPVPMSFVGYAGLVLAAAAR